MSNYTLFPMDCLLAMSLMDADSVDAIVTDPPYGLEFMGKDWDKGVPGPDVWAAALRVLKPGGHLLAFGGSRTYHRMACAIEDAGFELRDCIMWLYGSGFPKSHNGAWGGTALKPAHEPIVMARKPMVGTVAANVAKYGTGGLNIDGCRVLSADTIAPMGGKAILGGTSDGWDRPWKSNPDALAARQQRANAAIEKANTLGRWPANVIHDGSDEVLAAFPDAPGQQGDLTGHDKPRSSGSMAGPMGPAHDAVARVEASKSAARFFYCAKASTAERNAGLENFQPQRVQQGNHADQRVWDIPGSHSKPRANNHPTVKPLALMRYLCRLVTPPGGTVFDPFTGSGSTGVAALQEGFKFIGAEKEYEYAEIAEARLKHAS